MCKPWRITWVGTLLSLQVMVDRDTDKTWKRFVVLRKGFKANVAKVRLPSNFQSIIQVEVVKQLTGEDAELLRESFDAMRCDDRAATSAWQGLARQALTETTLDPNLREVFVMIRDARLEAPSEKVGQFATAKDPTVENNPSTPIMGTKRFDRRFSTCRFLTEIVGIQYPTWCYSW